MSRRHRLDRLEQDTAQASDDPSLCFRCRGVNTYRQRIDLARLMVGATGKLFGVNQEQARNTLREMLAQNPAELDHCRKCGELTPIGWVREDRAELGLDG